MLYSDFVTLLDGNRVRAARLESGNNRLYFDVRLPPNHPSLQPSTSAVAAAAPAAASTSATATAATTVAVAAATAAAAAPVAAVAAEPSTASGDPAPGAAAASAQASQGRQRFQRQFYIKLADKQDPVLLSRLLQVGAAVRDGLTSRACTLAKRHG